MPQPMNKSAQEQDCEKMLMPPTNHAFNYVWTDVIAAHVGTLSCASAVVL